MSDGVGGSRPDRKPACPPRCNVTNRERHTPYQAQLNAFLGEQPGGTFSAWSLAENFDHGHRDERSTLRGIESELKQAFASGRLIQFCNNNGEILIDRPGKHSSAQRKLPLYALPGADCPDGARTLTYNETLRPGMGDGNGRASPAAEVEADEPEERAEAGSDGEAAVEEPEATDAQDGERISLEDAIARLKAYPPGTETAPGWIEEQVLRTWVSHNEVCKHLLRGLDTAKGPNKLELIRAGVNRQKRGGWRPDSTVAGNLARLCRQSPVLWANVTDALLAHYLSSDSGVPADELPDLATDPLAYYDGSEHDPDAVLLCAMALSVDASVLEMIASDCAEVLGTQTVVDKKAAEQKRVTLLEAEVKELRGIAKQQDKDQAWRPSNPFHEHYRRLATRHGKNPAKSAVARKLLICSWHMLSRNQVFQPPGQRLPLKAPAAF